MPATSRSPRTSTRTSPRTSTWSTTRHRAGCSPRPATGKTGRAPAALTVAALFTGFGALLTATASSASAADVPAPVVPQAAQAAPGSYPVKCISQTVPGDPKPYTVCIYWPL